MNSKKNRYPFTLREKGVNLMLFSAKHYQIISPRGELDLLFLQVLQQTTPLPDFWWTDSKGSLDSFEFENEGFLLAQANGHMLRFALTTIVGSNQQIPETRFCSKARKLSIYDPERFSPLSPEDIFRVNPNTLTCPLIFQSRYDAEITKIFIKRVPVLVNDTSG